MSPSAFGEHLRRERELRGVSLEEVSAATRISISFLEALERGDWEKLPGGVFRRGFIRSTGRFLGLDEENLIAEYALETGDTSQTAVPAKAAGPDLRHGLFFGGVAAAILLIIASFFLWRHFAHRGVPNPVNREARPSAGGLPLPGVSVPGTPNGPAELPTKDAASTSDGMTKSGTAQNAAPSQTMPASAALTLSLPAAPQVGLIGGREAGSQQPAQPSGDMASGNPALSPLVPRTSEPAVSSKTQYAPTLLPSGLSLHIQAIRETRVRILADGEEIYKGTMTVGQWRNFRAVQGMEIFADDGGAIQLELNGKPVRDGGQHGPTFARHAAR